MEASGGTPTFEIEAVTDTGMSVVVVRGELDLATTPRLDDVLKEQRGRSLVLDLCGCTFMDSSGLSLIVRHADEARTAFVLACLPEGPPHRLLKLVGADAMLPTYPSRGEAVAALVLERPTAA